MISQIWMTEAVLFDMDDTLIYYKQGVPVLFREIFNQCFNNLNLDLKGFDFFMEWGRYNGINRSLEKLGIEIKPFREELDKILVQRIPIEIESKNITAFDDVIPALESLSQDYKLGIVTNHIKKSVDIIIGRLGIEEYLEVQVCPDAFDLQEKPSPEMIDFAKNKLNVKSAVYVGDSVTDIETAKNAKVPCIIIERETHRDKDYNVNLNYKPKIKDLRELIHLLAVTA